MFILSKKSAWETAVIFFAVLLIAGNPTFVFAETIAAPEVAPADTTGPVFTSIQAVSVLPNELTVVWTMDEAATSYLEYGATPDYGSSTPENAVASPEGTAVISGLAPDTKYYYRIVAKDIAGNISYSADHSATTAAEPIIQDNEPPVITEVGVTTVTTSTAVITALTSEPSQVRIEYGTTENYGEVGTSGEEFSLDHAVNLTGLMPNTLYHYRVIAEDEAGNVATSFDNTFTTGAVAVSEPATTATTTVITATTTTATSTSPETTATFAIAEPLAASVSTSTVKITWTTTEPAAGQVLYGKTAAYGSSTAQDTNFTVTHGVTLMGLSPETNYVYGVRATTSDGRSAAIDDLEFTTLPALTLSVAPQISNIKTSRIGTSTATIIWTTNTPTEGDLRYGTSTAYKSSAGKHTALFTDHVHEVQGLTPDTVYHYQAFVTDASGNTAVSQDKNFRTAALAGSQGISTGESSNENIVLLPDPPDTAPPPPPVLTGGAAPPTPLPKPALVKVDGLEGQVAFVFSKTSSNERIRIVRRNWVSPKNAWDGKIVYEGTAESFTDTGLVNGHTYHYGIYRVSQFRGVSKPILLTATPTAGKDQIQINAVPVSEPRTPRFTFGKDLAVGANGRDVKHLQALLKTDEKLYPQGLVTGYFGQLTKSALMNFQSAHGLTATGIAGPATRQKLEAFSALRYLPGGTPFSKDLFVGSQGSEVLALQKRLSEAGYYPEAIFSGYFGPLTRNAVMKFQTDNGIIPANGYFGPLTRHRIGELH